MTHIIHQEEGVVLDSYHTGESGRILKILTSDYGIITVVASGVRELKSKMRTNMDILQVVDFEYVVGKEMNRLIGIHGKEKFTNIYDLKKRRVVSNIVNFISRTVLGETKNEKLYQNFLEGVRVLMEDKRGETEGFAPNKDYLESLEIIWLIKILVSLGYWETGKMDEFKEDNFEFLKHEENKKNITEEINKSIRSTHL